MRKKIRNTSLAVLLTLGGALTANAAVCDLTALNSSCLNFGTPGANLYQAGIAPTGTGVIDSFVRLLGGDYIQGYNTDGRPLQYDEQSSPSFTRSLTLSAVPIVTIGGVQYREFVLDINQTNADPLETLDRIIISLRPAGNLLGGTVAVGSHLGAGTALFTDDTLVYDSGQTNTIELNYANDAGSGQGDVFLYVPNSAFTGPNTFVYLYSEFGATPNNNNDGFEEWAVRTPTTSAVPEPKQFIFTAAGAVLLFLMDYRRRRRNNLA